MTKKEFLDNFKQDFNKSRGSLQEIIEHNRVIDMQLVKDLEIGDFKKLEEHIEISRLMMDGVKSMNDLYANVPKIMENLDKLSDDNKGDKPSINIDDLLKDD
jgi:hypothetical protein